MCLKKLGYSFFEDSQAMAQTGGGGEFAEPTEGFVQVFDKVAAEASVVVVEDASAPACGLAGSWAEI